MEEGVLVTDPNNIIISVNPAFTAITGYTASEVIGKNPSMLSAGKHPPEFYKAMWQTLLEKGTWHGEIWERRKNGELFLKWLSIRVVRDEKGKLIHYMAVFSEISERKFAEERMQFQAHYDALTGLPNRIACADRLQQSLLQAKREQSRMAFMLLDLDKLKPLNESFGYDIGDVLIKEVAFRLQQCLNESETAARLGSDEFAVLVPRIETEYDARQIADKILHVLHQPYVLDGQRLHLYVSIGVVVYPEHGESEQQLVKNADIALGYAKGNAAEKVKIYHPGMKEMSEYMASAPTIWSLFFDIVSRNQPGRNNSGKTRLRLIRNSAQRDAEIQVLS
jgi:diguanylate cyclase (GGDEF)-like protein/PAS domain S-box-containing protein